MFINDVVTTVRLHKSLYLLLLENRVHFILFRLRQYEWGIQKTQRNTMSYANIFYNRRNNIIEENKMPVSPIREKSMQ